MVGIVLTQQELERRLWDAANSLRGPVDPADFKTYVFPMLFWKWISDTWDHEHAEAVDDYGENLNPEVEADYHRFALPDGTHWRQVTTRTDNLGSRIGKALDRIEQANPDSLAGIFGDAAWGNKERLPEPSLVALINAFSGLTLNAEVVPHDWHCGPMSSKRCSDRTSYALKAATSRSCRRHCRRCCRSTHCSSDGCRKADRLVRQRGRAGQPEQPFQSRGLRP